MKPEKYLEKKPREIIKQEGYEYEI